jgi:mannose-1-phosphate guanylyltransferase / mannose-6-phosphate isomerase
MVYSITPVIMCGGAGTRLWPASRQSFPKQFIALLGARSTFQETVLRVVGDRFEKPIVVANVDHRFVVAEQLQALGIDAEIVLEPERRDSGLTVAVGAVLGLRRAEDALLLVLAADHAIDDAVAFRAGCMDALPGAEAGHVVTLGIVPTEPSSAYGYLAPGELLADGKVRELAAFIEKPSRARAAEYIAAGCLWNSGNFLFRADLMRQQFAMFQPAIWAAAEASVENAVRDLDFLRLAEEPFRQAPQISIDYAIMEKTKVGAVLPVDFHWTDLGSWNAIWAHADRDANGNALSGPCEVVDVRNSLVRSDDAIVTAVIGLDDVAVVATPDAVLVAPRTIADELKGLHATLRGNGHAAASEHRRVYRPWGHYEIVQRGERHLVKRILVKPGARLSLQTHAYRSEHWVVVKGVAEVTLHDEVQRLGENESTFIPIGAVHRLANPGDEPLELIEVQVGDRLSEDDIVRLDDVYNRSGS